MNKYIIPPEMIISGNFCGETVTSTGECSDTACHECIFASSAASKLGIDRKVIRASFHRIWKECNGGS